MKSWFWRALLVSLLAHAVLFGAGRGWMEWQRQRGFEGMDIDLAHSSLLPSLPNVGGQRSSRPPEEWYLSDGRRLAPKPSAQTQTAQAVEDAPAGPPCPPPCPMNAGDWAPSTQSVKKPSWADGWITDADYPKEARYKNQVGLVVVQVLLDASGSVRDVQLLQSSYPSLTEKTLEKVRQARFTPCISADGRPFPCRLKVPVNWRLD